MNLGKLEEAIQYFNKAVKLDPKYEEAWNNKGISLMNLGKLEEGLTCVEKSIKLDSKYPLAWETKGNILEKQGKLNEALICFEKALELNPNVPEIAKSKIASGAISRIKSELKKESQEREKGDEIGLKKENDSLKEENKQLKEHNEKQEKKLKELSQKESDLELQIKSLKKELKQSPSTPSSLPSGRSNLETEIEKLKKRNEELNRELNSLRKLVLEIDMNEIKKGDLIGSGGFANVYQGSWKGKTVALKQMILSLDEKKLLDFDQEASLIKSLQHPNIIHLYGVVKFPNEKPIMVMEFFENGNLYDLLHKRKEILKFEEQLSIAFDISNGINYLHRLNPKIIHRDLKSANVLLTKEKKAVLTDFGLARVKMETQKMTKSTAGTTNWMAPEMFDEEGKLTEKVDVYSFGMILFEISTNLIPFEGKIEQQIILSVYQGKRPIIPDHCNPFFKPLIEQCWIQDYSKRPSIIEICAKLELKRESFFSEPVVNTHVEESTSKHESIDTLSSPSTEIGLSVVSSYAKDNEQSQDSTPVSTSSSSTSKKKKKKKKN